MGKEDRLKNKNEGKDEGESDGSGEGEIQEKKKEEKTKEEEDESKDPPHEDCMEYKLVGATVHSGTAHAGHYWSYINTKRGREEA